MSIDSRNSSYNRRQRTTKTVLDRSAMTIMLEMRGLAKCRRPSIQCMCATVRKRNLCQTGLACYALARLNTCKNRGVERERSIHFMRYQLFMSPVLRNIAWWPHHRITTHIRYESNLRRYEFCSVHVLVLNVTIAAIPVIGPTCSITLLVLPFMRWAVSCLTW
jgi:hypothetical protein